MSAGAPRVIVIDDDPSVRTSMVRLLRTAGDEVEALGSARAFLERPPTAVPACLVLDVRLPALTGLELQGLLASTGRGPAIVFITGHPDVPASVSAMKGGAVDFLTKPVRAQDLLEAIARAVAQSAQVRLMSCARVGSVPPGAFTPTKLLLSAKLGKRAGSWTCWREPPWQASQPTPSSIKSSSPKSRRVAEINVSSSAFASPEGGWSEPSRFSSLPTACLSSSASVTSKRKRRCSGSSKLAEP